MARNFFERLRSYYLDVAAVLRGEASAASIFPNPTDIGASREQAYAEFLKQHAPSKCNVFFGGFLFGSDGAESGQLDVIVTTDTTPRFNLHNRDGSGKSFSPVEGCLAIASIKSTLNKAELEDALLGIARIPATAALDGRVNPMLRVKNYDDWPYKIVYANDGLAIDTMIGHIDAFYRTHPTIPSSRRPNIIHVCGKYAIFRIVPGMGVWDRATSQSKAVEPGTFYPFVTDPDLQGIVEVLNNLQKLATASNHILYSYHDIINRINGISDVD